MPRKAPNYVDWKGREDFVEEAFREAGLNLEDQPQGFGARPDFALCDTDGRRLCFLEVKGYVKSEYTDVVQAARHLEISKDSEWGELHYFTPDGTDSRFGKNVKALLAQAGDRVKFHPESDIEKVTQELSERVEMAEARLAEPETDVADEGAGELQDHASDIDVGTDVADQGAGELQDASAVDVVADVVDTLGDIGKKVTGELGGELQ